MRRYKSLLEYQNNIYLELFNKLSIEEKIERLSIKKVYDKNLFYHVTERKNVDKILNYGFKGDELWFSKETPIKDYSTGILLACDLDKFRIKYTSDSRWKKEDNVVIVNDNISSKVVVRIFDYFDDLDMREDYLLIYIIKNHKNPEDIINEHNL